MNVLKSHLKTTVVTLSEKGVSQREIERRTGVSAKTIRHYVREALGVPGEANSRTPATGSELPSGQIPAPRPPTGEPLAGRSKLPWHAKSACEAHREWIEAQVRLGRNAMAIYQQLVDERGFTARYNSVKRFCRSLRVEEPEQFDRLEFSAGEECQVDYGEGALTRHPKTGKYRRPRLFVMTLRYSRRAFRKVVWKSSSQVWAQLHEEAWRYFGGSCEYVVLDNLKEGVIKPDIYEPELNRVYAEMLKHYSVTADPARVNDPNRKGAVECGIKHTQSTALKGKKFESIEEQNEFLMHWEEKWAASRIHGRAKRQVEAIFQEEKPHLQVLPLEPFRYFKEETRTVQDDRTVQIDDSWYAARPARIGTLVIVRIFEQEIQIRDFNTLELLRNHPRAYKKGDLALPEADRIFNPSRQTRRLLRRAGEIGPNTQALCQRLFDQRGRESQKTMWGIVGLVPRYPAILIEQAVLVANARNLASVKALRTIAENLIKQALEKLAAEKPVPLTQQHELIREPGVYGEFFNQNVLL